MENILRVSGGTRIANWIINMIATITAIIPIIQVIENGAISTIGFIFILF